MKKIKLLFTLFLLLTISMQAQEPPNAFNYSAVARDAAGEPIATTTIGIQVSILQSSTIGSAIYVENHFVNTDDFGLFNLIIGAGAAQTGTMENIAWDTDDFYLQIGLDANGGTNFLTMGTTQLLSVPYALHAATADSLIGGSSFSGDYNDLSNQPITISSMSQNGDSLLLSNGQTFVTGGSGTGGGGFTHYIGEEFGEGVIFHLWKDNAGVEHGLIVDKTAFSTFQSWSNLNNTLIGTSAQSSWDGLSNSNAIVGQAGHTSSAAALCLNSTNNGQSDWYLPSIDELSLLWHSRFNVNKTLSAIGGASVLPNVVTYWSSTESSGTSAWKFVFSDGTPTTASKISTYSVRAVRAF